MTVRPLLLSVLLLSTSLALAYTPTGEALRFPRERVDDPATIAVARALYGIPEPAVYGVTDDAFHLIFPTLQLYVVIDPRLTPAEPHAMAVRPSSGTAFDATRHFNEMLLAENVLILTAEKALQVASAYVDVVNTELLLEKRVATVADAGAMGVPVSPPRASVALHGWTVTATSWSPTSGHVLDWVLELSHKEVLRSAWQHRAVVGTPDPHHLFLKQDMTVVNEHAGGAHSFVARDATGQRLSLPSEADAAPRDLLATRANADGTVWRVYAPSTIPRDAVVLSRAAALADAAVFAYAHEAAGNHAACSPGSNPGPHWGFASADPDCVFEIIVSPPLVLSCVACAMAGYDVRLRVSASYVEELQGPGSRMFTNPAVHDASALARLLVGHELFHSLQYAIGEWAHRDALSWHGWLGVYEGQARVAETVLVPDVVADPSSWWWTAVRQHQAMPHGGVCDRGYDAALFQGQLYAEDGGFEAFRRLLRAIPHAERECVDGLGRALNATLSGGTGEHGHHEAFLRDHSLHVLARDFAWPGAGEAAPRAWGGTTAVATRPIERDGDPPAFLAHGGRVYLTLPPGRFELTCVTGGPVVADVLHVRGGLVTSTPSRCGMGTGEEVDTRGDDAAYLVPVGIGAPARPGESLMVATYLREL